MSDELVHLEVAGGVATVTLDSPANRNALSTALVVDLDRQLAAALEDAAVRVVVLAATGPAFCSGADLREQLARNESGGRGTALRGVPDILETIRNAPKPVVARVQGPARAGGLGLVAACDISVAADDATFGFSEVRLGVIPAIISVVCVPKLGVARSMELFLTGEPFTASQAAEWGLVTAAVPAAELNDAVGRHVVSLLKGGPLALAGAKRLVRDVAGMSGSETFRAMGRLSAEYFASEEAREGMRAFREKRPPTWAE
jgi:methylglutaconyl-CoA hydratase